MQPLRTTSIALFLFLSLAGRAGAWQDSADGVYLSCSQEPAQLLCDYRSTSTLPVTYAAGTASGQELPAPELNTYPWSGAATAILVIVDTSDPGRQPVIEANVRQIQALVGWLKPHHKAGLGTFDRELRMLVPIGSSREQLLSAAGGLQATGMTTELYRSQLQAIEILQHTAADRKALIVFSDGQAEDQAYFHDDVIAAARDAGVVIHTFGFARSTALSVALQTLRRLSEGTGGLYAESDAAFALPDTTLAAPLYAIDTGGRLRFDLPAILKVAPAASAISLTFSLGTGKTNVDVPLENPAGAIPVAQSPGTAVEALPAPQATVTSSSPAEVDRPDAIFWYGLPVLLLLLVAATLVAMYFLFRRAQTVAKGGQVAAAPAYRPLAYLVSQETHPRSFPITREIWRIGRSRDNELTLDDNSISRRHAEIQRRPDGKFYILDRHSTNGIFINGRRVGSGELHEGDIVEIGDVALRFTESIDYQLGENTAVMNTHSPVH